MQLVKGRDLQQILDDGPLPPSRAVKIIEQICPSVAGGAPSGHWSPGEGASGANSSAAIIAYFMIALLLATARGLCCGQGLNNSGP
jgi:hypothetical protein